MVLNASTPVSQALAEELLEFSRSRWPDFPHKHLDEVEFLAKLPRNATALCAATGGMPQMMAG
ncbi:hypothetical protein [Verminephrobacter aporrectodeae]|uniref:hypothetical protein n=1 Tax=Verminephrobacter aporrectodeae TaxID=1110389 RepID=UPI000497B2C1|nr:hypothetical protein [Verminephrobacter aporrectodeae]